MVDALNRNLKQNQLLQYSFDYYWSAQAPTAHHRHGPAHSDGTGINELSILSTTRPISHLFQMTPHG